MLLMGAALMDTKPGFLAIRVRRNCGLGKEEGSPQLRTLKGETTVSKKSKCNQKNQIERRGEGLLICYRHKRRVRIEGGKCADPKCVLSPAVKAAAVVVSS